jgi:hypothetical protein
MITLPEHVLSTDECGGWDGTSVDLNTNDVVPNKETSMSWAEHQRIVCEARSLLTGNIVMSPSAVKKTFLELQSAYNKSDSRSVIRVSKGIHQPATNPHLQLRMVTTFYQQGGQAQEKISKFHLDVSAQDTPEMADRFQWVGVRFSLKEGATVYKWPANANPVISKKARRNSVSFADLNDHIQKVAEETAKNERKAWLEQQCSTYGINKSNLSKLGRGISVPGTGGAYQLASVDSTEMTFQKTGTRGYKPV